MKRMHFLLNTILTTLTLYFFNNTSTIAIDQFPKVTIYTFMFHYNFISPHGSLNDCTHTEVAIFKTSHSNKNNCS